MSDATNFRMERIEKLLNELRYEIERGFMSREIDETITYRFFFPISHVIPDGVVACQFQTRPVPSIHAIGEGTEPHLRLVKTGVVGGIGRE